MRRTFTSRSDAEIFRDGIVEGAEDRLISCDIFPRTGGYVVVWSIR